MIPAERYRPVIHDKDFDIVNKCCKLAKGSVDYQLWWAEQLKRCRDGYKPHGGTWIPGNYYFYINFCNIELLDQATNRKTIGPSLYRDQDHEYFMEVNKAKENGYGIIVLKGRRKGFSFNNAGIALHEWSMYAGSQSGVGAQKKDYVADWRTRMLNAYNLLPKELRNRTLTNNADKLVSGYKVKVDGEQLNKGLNSAMHWRVMEKPDAFRGLSLAYLFFEEAGEFRELKKALEVSAECFREGSIQFGCPVIGGTSNQLSNDSDDFKKMYYNPEPYNLKSLFISAAKVYHGFFNKSTGVSDIEGAEKDLERRAAEKKSLGLTEYYTFLQENPTKPEHAFMQSGTTAFDLAKINAQLANLAANKTMRIAQYGTLTWPKDKQNRDVILGRPEFKYDPHGDFLIVEAPLTGIKNGHVAAADPYHVNEELEEKAFKSKSKDDEDKGRKSKGCMYVYRRFINTNVPCEMPVAEYCKRPESKEEFYESCLKLCVYYETQVLVEYNDEGFLKYFIDNKATRYLKERPRAADSPWSTANNRYGLHMKEHQKRLLVELVDEYIKAHCEDIYFEGLLKEFVVYGRKNTDRVSAFGMCLIHDLDMVRTVKNGDEVEEPMRLPTFIKNSQGIIKPSITKEKNNNFVETRKIRYNYDL